MDNYNRGGGERILQRTGGVHDILHILTYRHTGRQRHTYMETETERQIEGNSDTHTARERDTQGDRDTHIQIEHRHRHTGTHI